MPPGRRTSAAKSQAASARRIALWARPQSSQSPSSQSPSSPNTLDVESAPSPPPPPPPPVLPRPPPPPSAPPLLNPPSAASPASATSSASVESATTAASPAASPAISRASAATRAPDASNDADVATRAPAASQARSIRSKALYVRGAKNKRGVVTGSKTDTLVRLTGKKIVIKYCTFHNGPTDRESCSLLSRDIGSCVRDCVPMIQPTFSDLKEIEQDIVTTYLTTNYEIAIDDHGMWGWIGEQAANRYRQWKHKCKGHWEQYGDDLPLEFLNRPEQWDWLLTHFKDEKFQALCTRNQGNRISNPNQLNHHSGALALSYRASEHAKKGSQVPYVAAFLEAYEPDPKAKDVLEKVKRKLDEVIETQSDGSAESIPVDDQVTVIEVGMGRKKGTSIRGVGAALRRDPRKRGGARQSFTDTQAEERIQKAMEEAQLAKEEAQRAIEEAQRAKEEAERAKEEFQRAREETRGVMDRLQALEAAAAANQVQPSGSSTQILTAHS